MNNNFQAKGAAQGRDWKEVCCLKLNEAGFEIDARWLDMQDAGVEVDIVATNRAAISFYITCKGSIEGDRPGCERTDTLKKALEEANQLHRRNWTPVLLLTSHLPRDGRGKVQLRNALADGYLFDALDPTHSLARLRWLARATEAELRADLDERRSLFDQAPERGWGRWTPKLGGRARWLRAAGGNGNGSGQLGFEEAAMGNGKLRSLAQEMRSDLARAGQGVRRTQRDGLVIDLYLRHEQWRLVLRREDRLPSADEVRVYGEAFGVAEGTEPVQASRREINPATQRLVPYKLVELAWRETVTA